MTYKFARRTEGIGVSLIRQMFNYAADVPGYVSLGVGIPPFEMTQYTKQRLVDGIYNNTAINKYTLGKGLPSLNSAFSRKLESKGISADPSAEILTTAGAAGGIFCAFMSMLDDGDEVVMPSPAYSNHISVVEFAGAVPVHVPLDESCGWGLDADKISRAVNDRTKAIVVCNPSNPVGAVFSMEELKSIGEIAKGRKLVVFEDNSYDFLTYDGARHFSLLSTEFRTNTVGFYSSSKEHAMTGLRVGWVVAPKEIIDRTSAVQDTNYICPPSLSQYAALAAMEGPQDHVEQFRMEFQRRRDVICERLDRTGFEYVKPSGAYYVFPRIPATISDNKPRNKKAEGRFEEIPEKFRTPDTAAALDLLYDKGVVTVPGISFGDFGRNHIRLSFAADEKDINEAFDRIEDWLRRR